MTPLKPWRSTRGSFTPLGLTDLVEDNTHTSPHNNHRIRDSHIDHNVKIVVYSVTDAERDETRALIQQQMLHTGLT